MSLYEWQKIEYTCDTCKKKHKNGDRCAEIPVGWIVINGFKYQSQVGCTSSSPGTHFCSVECLVKCVQK